MTTSPSHKKIAVITAIIGQIDEVKEIPEQSVQYDRFVIKKENDFGHFPNVISHRLMSKYFKTQIHKLPQFADYTHYVWLDGSIQVKSPYFVETFTSDVFVIGKHPYRHCIFEEAQFITHEINSGNEYLSDRYHAWDIQNAIEILKKLGAAEGRGLWAAGIFGRANNPFWNAIFDQWWDMIFRFDPVDQLSLGAILQNPQLNFTTINYGESLTNNDLFDLIPHNY